MNPIGIRWLFVGSIVYVVELICFLLLYQLTAVVLITNLGSMLISGGLGFFANQFFVYRIRANKRELMKYSLSVCISIILHTGFLILLIANSSIPIQIAKVLTSLILLPVSFFLSNLLFKQKVRLLN